VIIQAFTRAFQQLPERKFRSVLIRGLLLTVVLYVCLFFVVDYFIAQIQGSGFEWLDGVLQAAGWLGFALAAFVLFPALASFFMAFFLDDVAHAVEQKHYPGEPAGRSASFLVSLRVSARFTAILILLNLLVLPLYLIPFINLFLYYALNGYLLSREYFELVGIRHLPAGDVHRRRKTSGGRLMLVGIVIAFLLTIPVVNFLAPLVATAAMVHVFKALPAKANA
jgi:uncharacterized protein involved in cysteine biosynthesis